MCVQLVSDDHAHSMETTPSQAPPSESNLHQPSSSATHQEANSAVNTMADWGQQSTVQSQVAQRCQIPSSLRQARKKEMFGLTWPVSCVVFVGGRRERIAG